jgi:hypothetical protein
MAAELQMSDAEWAVFYQCKVTAMIAAGQAYVDAGGRANSELERAILGVWNDASGSAYWQARNRVKLPDGEALHG